MRQLLILSCVLVTLVCSSAGNADRSILLPTGTTLTTGQVRAEALFSYANDHGNYQMLATGFQQFEFNATRVEFEGGRRETLLGAQWSFLPETFFTPAVGFGVRDATSQSKEGIGVYGAITKHFPTGPAQDWFSDFSVTVGLGAKSLKGPFASTEFHLPHNIFVQAEYSQEGWNAALGWQPLPLVRLKTYSLSNLNYVGAELIPIEF